MRIIAVANQKGGVGKTTTTVNIAAAIGLTGVPVVVIDCDPQANASHALGVPRVSERTDIYDVIIDMVPLSEAQVATRLPNVSCVPSSVDLAGAEVELVAEDSREARLARALADVTWPTNTVVLIDCPPSLGLLTVNALVAADELLVPIQAEFYALDGVSQLVRTMELIRSSLNPSLEVGLVALTMVSDATPSQSQVIDEVAGFFGDRVAHTMIPRDVAASAAPANSTTAVSASPQSDVARAYRQLATELMTKLPTAVNSRT